MSVAARKPSERIDLGEGAWLEWAPGFLADAGLPPLPEVVAELPLRRDRFMLFGRSVPVPRLVCWHGDPGCTYRYSGQTYEPESWTPTLARLRTLLQDHTGLDFNGVLANYYRDGADSVGWHADDERELGPSASDVAIASLSLGAERRFRMRHRADGRSRDWTLMDGSLFVMRGTTQQHWRHCLPKTRRPVGPRLNLTFRVVCP